ncbi:MAG: hypothetical protein JJU05_13470 [Verrucomicrobia bacterium]|nr:hypothetical protein [Verrucomicrobiota bacterium]MCH8527445.1 hypothetical protein [Kiritimatiellia bacterium]
MKSPHHQRLFGTLIFIPAVFLTATVAASEFTVRLLSWTTSVHEHNLFLKHGDEFIELDIRSNRRSEPYPLGEDRIASFFMRGVNVEGEQVMVPIARTEIRKGMKEPLLILFASGNQAQNHEYTAVAVEDTPEFFPFGSYRVFNFTPVRIVMEMEGEIYPMEPRNIQVLKPKENNRVNLPIRVHAVVNGEPQVIRETFWRHQPTQRMMVFIMASPVPGRQELILRTVSEREGAYRLLMENGDGP